MVSPKQKEVFGFKNLEQKQQDHDLDGKLSSIDIISQKQYLLIAILVHKYGSKIDLLEVF